MRKKLIKYIRNANNHPYGVVIALDRERIGWSRCSRKDRWQRKLGLMIAEGRATANKPCTCTFKEVNDAIIDMRLRAMKYFKPMG